MSSFYGLNLSNNTINIEFSLLTQKNQGKTVNRPGNFICVQTPLIIHNDQKGVLGLDAWLRNVR